MKLKNLLRGLLILVLSLILFVVGVIGYVQLAHRSDIKSIDQLSPAPVAMVLGASIKPNSTPSDALRDRLTVGIDLYRRGIVQKLLLTGDDGGNKNDEVDVMKAFAMKQGVPKEAILVDPHGYRTYESCRNATETFHIRQAIIVTQRFHLARALYLCETFGIRSEGTTADLQPYQQITFFWLRDLAASFKAWWDVNIHTPAPMVR